jgi:hypothetical protein
MMNVTQYMIDGVASIECLPGYVQTGGNRSRIFRDTCRPVVIGQESVQAVAPGLEPIQSAQVRGESSRLL